MIIKKITAVINLILSGLIGFSNALLLALQKNCEFCSILIGPILLFSFFTLTAFVYLKTESYSQQKSKNILFAINAIGVLVSLVYLSKTYLL
jgi:hypothetical protein